MLPCWPCYRDGFREPADIDDGFDLGHRHRPATNDAARVNEEQPRELDVLRLIVAGC